MHPAAMRRRRAAADSRKQRAERSEVATSDEDGISGYGREIGNLSLSPVKRAGGREGREDGPAGDDAGSPEGARAQPRSAGDRRGDASETQRRASSEEDDDEGRHIPEIEALPCR